MLLRMLLAMISVFRDVNKKVFPVQVDLAI